MLSQILTNYTTANSSENSNIYYIGIAVLAAMIITGASYLNARNKEERTKKESQLEKLQH